MVTYNIEISEEQLQTIMDALHIQVEVKTFKEDISIAHEEEDLIAMIQDVLDEQNTEVLHGFCY